MIELAMACNQPTALAQYGRKTSRCALILVATAPPPAGPATL